MMKGKFAKRLLAASAIAALLLGGTFGLAQVAGAQEKTVVWNLPHVAAPTYYHITNLKAFAEKLKEISKGRMEVRVHPASSLYPQQELIPALVDGRVEVAPVLSSYLVDLFLACGVLELPFMTNTIQEHQAAAFKLRPFYAAQLAKHGVLLKAIETWPSQQVYSTKEPIAKVEDWKGKKIRIYGVEASEFVKSMGAAPTNIPFGELYTALQRNVVDGAVTSATNAEPMKFFEVTKYMNYWSFNAAAPEWLGVNKKAWDALPPDLQKAFDAALKESRFEEKEWEDAISWDLRARKRIQELGMTVVDIPKAEIEKARQKSKPVWKMWLKRTGPDGKKALEEASKALGRPLL
jgi:TRAP-type C4-dicarboxylate transport system substrate-binding protein